VAGLLIGVAVAQERGESTNPDMHDHPQMHDMAQMQMSSAEDWRPSPHVSS